MTDASSRDGDDPASESRAPPHGADAPPGAKDESLGDADAPPGAKGESLGGADAPLGAKDLSLRSPDDPVRAAGAPPADAGEPRTGADAPLATVIPLQRRVTQAARAFLERPKTRNFVASLVRAMVPAADVEDVVHDALEEAVEALKRSPPSREEAFSGWLASITHHIVADYHKKRARRAKYEGPVPVEARDEDGDPPRRADERGDPQRRAAEPSFDPRTADEDPELEAGRIFDWLEREVAKRPRDRETFEMMLEHYRTGKTYQQIADERGLPLTAVSQRIFVFKTDYVSRYRRRRERMLWLLFLGGVALVLGVVLALWLLRRDPIRPEIEPLPAPSATTTQEPFDPALAPSAPPKRDKP